MCIHNVESSAHAAKNRAEAQSNSMEITAPVTDKEEPGAQSSDTKNQFPDLFKSQNNRDQAQSDSLEITAPVSDKEEPDAQSSDTKNQFPDLSKSQNNRDQIPQLNELPLEATAEFSIPNKYDLREINSMLGGDWRNLALLISSEKSKKMIGITRTEAKKKVRIHFREANEKRRKKLTVPFDVTLKDIVTRIQDLLSADIHWSCLANCLKELESDRMIEGIYYALPDFNTFWATFSMPNYSAVSSEKNIMQAENDDRVFVDELNKLREEVELEDRRHELPRKDRENNKFCHFLEKKNLLNYAKSSKDKLYEKFIQLSTMKVDMSKWREYLNRFGIRQFKKKNSGKHYCITYTLQNPDCIGEQVIAKNSCVGSLGWPLENIGGAKCQLTSSHVLLNEKRLLFLGKRENINRMVKLEHTMLCRLGKKLGIGCDLECFCFSKEIIGLISSGCYKNGDSESAGMEIAVIMIGNQYRLINQDAPAGLLYDQWKTFDFPDTLNFNGQVQHHDKIDIKMTVYKFGKITGLTKGHITNKECTFEFHHPFSQKKENPTVVTLKNQYEVAWEECPFSEEGDSGGPVFTVNKESGEITAIGLLTGNNKKKEVSFVTPLHHVRKAFRNEFRLQNFEIKLQKKSNLFSYSPNCASSHL